MNNQSEIKENTIIIIHLQNIYCASVKMYLGAVSDFEINAPAMHQIILYYPTNNCEHIWSIKLGVHNQC